MQLMTLYEQCFISFYRSLINLNDPVQVKGVIVSIHILECPISCNDWFRK